MKTARCSVAKTILPLLLVGLVANAQVRHQPNPNADADIRLVTALLHDLADGQPEAAYDRLTDDFRYRSSAFGPFSGAYELLLEWGDRQRRFTNQRMTVEKTSTHTVPAGPRQGTWVYLEGTWTALEGDLPTKISFRQWARLRDGKLAELYLTPTPDPLFAEFAALVKDGSNP